MSSALYMADTLQTEYNKRGLSYLKKIHHQLLFGKLECCVLSNDRKEVDSNILWVDRDTVILASSEFQQKKESISSESD